MNTLIRSRAPLRLGLAGGGTDVSPFSDRYGGCVLNVTINMYAHCVLETTGSDTVEFIADDMDLSVRAPSVPQLDLTGDLILHKAVYNRVVRDFNQGRPLSVKIRTWADAPPGSGLGSSSTMVVSMLAAYRELLGLALGEYDLAHLAFEIERLDCDLIGGKQDQYAATFGGFNFMEFYEADRVIVNPLRIRKHIENEFQANLMLYFTGTSRESAVIIKEQIDTTERETDRRGALDAMHEVKDLSYRMKERLLKGDVPGIATELKTSWEAKKRMARSIGNSQISEIESAALDAGASAIKISGAGGGGFMILFVDPNFRKKVTKALAAFPGRFQNFEFTSEGAIAWEVR